MEELHEIVSHRENFLAGLSENAKARRERLFDQIELHLEISEHGGVEKMLTSFELVMRRVEIAAVILGTLQWGFGDILVNKLTGCGEWLCS